MYLVRISTCECGGRDSEFLESQLATGIPVSNHSTLTVSNVCVCVVCARVHMCVCVCVYVCVSVCDKLLYTDCFSKVSWLWGGYD